MSDSFVDQLEQIAADLHRQHKTNALIDRLTTSIAADELGRVIFPWLSGLVEDCLNGELYAEGQRVADTLERVDYSWVVEKTVLSVWKSEKSKPVTRTDSVSLVSKTKYWIESSDVQNDVFYDLLIGPLYARMGWFFGDDRWYEDDDQTNTKILIQFAEMADVFI